MRGQWDVLIASSNMEDRASLTRILDKLSLNVISCSALNQVHEVLSRQDIPLVFCDESLTGGCDGGLLAPGTGRQNPRIVFTIRNGNWDEHLNPTQNGRFDAIRFPLQPTDVELIVLRTLRENREAAFSQGIGND